MSYEFSSTKNKQQRHPKVHFSEYLYNAGEPREDKSYDSSADSGDQAPEDRHFMRRQLKRTAQILRSRYT